MEKKEKYSNCCPDCWNTPFALKTRFEDGICGIACDTCTHGNFEREPVGSNWCMCGKEWRGLRYHEKGHGKKIIATPAPEDWKDTLYNLVQEVIDGNTFDRIPDYVEEILATERTRDLEKVLIAVRALPAEKPERESDEYDLGLRNMRNSAMVAITDLIERV